MFFRFNMIIGMSVQRATLNARPADEVSRLTTITIAPLNVPKNSSHFLSYVFSNPQAPNDLRTNMALRIKKGRLRQKTKRVHSHSVGANFGRAAEHARTRGEKGG